MFHVRDEASVVLRDANFGIPVRSELYVRIQGKVSGPAMGMGMGFWARGLVFVRARRERITSGRPRVCACCMQDEFGTQVESFDYIRAGREDGIGAGVEVLEYEHARRVCDRHVVKCCCTATWY